LWITIGEKAKIRAPLRIASPKPRQDMRQHGIGRLAGDRRRRVAATKKHKRLLQRNLPAAVRPCRAANGAKKEVDGPYLARLLAPARA
jgi:hypothetical protein